MWLLLLIIFTFSLPKFLKKYFAEGIHKATVLQVKVLHVWVTPGFRLLNTIMLYRWSRIVEKYFWSGHSPTVVFQEAKFWVKWKEMTFDLKIFFSSGSFCSFITFKFFSFLQFGLYSLLFTLFTQQFMVSFWTMKCRQNLWHLFIF